MSSRHKPKLRDLSRQDPSYEEQNAVHQAFAAGAPIVVAILGQAMVEFELDKLLRSRFGRIDDEMWSALTDDRGPFRTFDAKIIAGRAFRLYDAATQDHLNRIRNIRNAFAHAKLLIDFENPLILKELRNAAFPPRPHSRLHKQLKKITSPATTGRAAYKGLCEETFIVLIRRHTKGLTVSSANYKRAISREERRNPFANALMTQGLMTRGYRGGLIGSSHPSRTGDPSRLAHGVAGLLSGVTPPARLVPDEE